jgi:hypothetical protein
MNAVHAVSRMRNGTHGGIRLLGTQEAIGLGEVLSPAWQPRRADELAAFRLEARVVEPVLIYLHTTFFPFLERLDRLRVPEDFRGYSDGLRLRSPHAAIARRIAAVLETLFPERVRRFPMLRSDSPQPQGVGVYIERLLIR